MGGHAGRKRQAVCDVPETIGAARLSMQWLLGDAMSTQKFFAEVWEKQPLVVHRRSAGYYGSLFDREALLRIAKAQRIDFGADVTIAKHDTSLAGKDGGIAGGADWHGELPPEQHPTGRVSAERLKQLFGSGHTAQVFATQKKTAEVKALCLTLEAELLSLVGCTAYLTPPHSQGIAPHHDDVEVIILQTQGSKCWQLYTPHHELSHRYEKTPPGTLGTPTLEVTLQQGDLLYIPRGFIHQARATAEFSTHLTVSTYQSQSWGDFLSAALPPAIEEAIESDVAFRRGLPLRSYEHLGTAGVAGVAGAAASGGQAKLREARKVVGALVGKLAGYVDVAQGMDALCYEFMTRRMGCEVAADGAVQHGHCGSRRKSDTVVSADKKRRLAAVCGLTMDTRVALLFPGHSAMLVRDVDSDDEDDAEEEDEGEEEDHVVVLGLNDTVAGGLRNRGDRGGMARGQAGADGRTTPLSGKKVSSVRICDGGVVCEVANDGVASEEEGEEEDREDGEDGEDGDAGDCKAPGPTPVEGSQRRLVVVTTRTNSPERHLLPFEDLPAPHQVTLDLAAAPAVAAIFAAPPFDKSAAGGSAGGKRAKRAGVAGGVRIRDLPMSSDAERLDLVSALVLGGVVCVA